MSLCQYWCMSPSQTRPVSPHPQVLVQRLPGGEIVLLHMESEVYFGLDAVGARVWEAMHQTGNLEGAVQSLRDVFEVDEDRLRRDVEALAEDLIEAGLLVEVAE